MDSNEIPDDEEHRLDSTSDLGEGQEPRTCHANHISIDDLFLDPAPDDSGNGRLVDDPSLLSIDELTIGDEAMMPPSKSERPAAPKERESSRPKPPPRRKRPASDDDIAIDLLGINGEGNGNRAESPGDPNPLNYLANADTVSITHEAAVVHTPKQLPRIQQSRPSWSFGHVATAAVISVGTVIAFLVWAYTTPVSSEHSFQLSLDIRGSSEVVVIEIAEPARPFDPIKLFRVNGPIVEMDVPRAAYVLWLKDSLGQVVSVTPEEDCTPALLLDEMSQLVLELTLVDDTGQCGSP